MISKVYSPAFCLILCMLLLAILPQSHAQQPSVPPQESDTLDNITISEAEARNIMKGLFDLPRLTHSLALGRIAKDEHLTAFTDGFMQRNNIQVLTIGYIDSDEFWPRIFRQQRLGKINKADNDNLLAAKIIFVPASTEGPPTGYTTRLELTGKTSTVYELLSISQAEVDSIAASTSQQQLGSTTFATPNEAKETVVSALIAALEGVENKEIYPMLEDSSDSLVVADSLSVEAELDSLTSDSVELAGLIRDANLFALKSLPDTLNTKKERFEFKYIFQDTLDLVYSKLEILKVSAQDTVDVVAFFDLPKGIDLDFIDGRDNAKGWNGTNSEGKFVKEGTYLIKVSVSNEVDFKDGYMDYDQFFATDPNEPEFPVTVDQLKQIFPGKDTARIREVVNLINQLSNEYGLTSKERMSHFLGQIGTETNGLEKLVESSNYSAKNVFSIFLQVERTKASGTELTHKYCDLIQGYDCSDLSSCPENYAGPLTCSTEPDYVFPTKVVDGKTLPDFDTWDASHDVKSSYVNSSTLFDYVYSCRMENGAKSTGDGSKYLGKGFIHMTGKDKYKRVSNAWNKKYPADKKEFHGPDIDLLETNVDVAMKASLVLWELDKMNDLADEGTGLKQIKKVTKKVNGGYNGLDMRQQYTEKALEVFGSD
jgi:predicted chitinase